MRGLKANITLTLMILLATSMVLIAMTTVTLWQRHLVGKEKEHALTLLQTIVTTSDSEDELIIGLQIVTDLLEGSCGIVASGNQFRKFSNTPCTQNRQMRSLLIRARQSGDSTLTHSGSILNLFTNQQSFILAALPFSKRRDISGALGIIIPLEPALITIRQGYRFILVYILMNVLILATIGFFRLRKMIISPIEQLAQLTSSYDKHKGLPLLHEKEGNEFHQLSSALHSMLKRIEQDRQKLRDTVQSLEQSNLQLQETQLEMVRTEKLASIGRLSAGLAHEIGNPIGIIQGYLELLQKNSLSDEDRLQYSTRATAELNRINMLIRQLLDFSRTAPPGKQKIDINTLILDIVDMLSNQKKMENIRFETNLDAKQSVIEASEEGVRQVLLNILLNAVDAINEKKGSEPFLTDQKPSKRALTPFFPGEISISTENPKEEDGRHNLIIMIKDNGCGIAPDNLGNIFDPFFTTKEPGKGTGLGLSVSHSIIEAAGGRIEASSTPDIGSEIRITLPVPEEGCQAISPL